MRVLWIRLRQNPNTGHYICYSLCFVNVSLYLFHVEQLSTEPGDDEYVKKKMTAPGEESPRVKDETKHEETVYDGLV